MKSLVTALPMALLASLLVAACVDVSHSGAPTITPLSQSKSCVTDHECMSSQHCVIDSTKQVFGRCADVNAGSSDAGVAGTPMGAPAQDGGAQPAAQPGGEISL